MALDPDIAAQFAQLKRENAVLRTILREAAARTPDAYNEKDDDGKAQRRGAYSQGWRECIEFFLNVGKPPRGSETSAFADMQ